MFSRRSSRSSSTGPHSGHGNTGSGSGSGSGSGDGRAARLDPVRWRPPGRGMLIRTAAVAALLGTASVIIWTRPVGCTSADLTSAAALSAADVTGAAPGPGAHPNSANGSGPADGAEPTDGAGPTDNQGSRDGVRSAAEAGSGVRSGTGTGSELGSGSVSGADGGMRADVVPGAAARPGVPAGTVGVPVRLAEPSALRLVHAGDRVDLIGVDPTRGRTSTVADDALVLGVTGADDPTVGGLLLALDHAEAQRAVGAAEQTRFAVLIRPRQ
jgi:hypothetical protein